MSLGFKSTLLFKGIFAILPGAPAAPLHLAPLLTGAPEVSMARHFMARRLCWRWASHRAPGLFFTASPTAIELPNMLSTAVLKRPTEWSILRAGKGA